MPASRPPEIAGLLELLEVNSVNYIVVGSVAASLYGVELKPNDLDVVPEMSSNNLEKLGKLLNLIDARHTGSGRWETTELGEKKWIEEKTGPDFLESWRPDTSDRTTFDHLFHTRLGNFDIMPEVAGTYEKLLVRAVSKVAFGHKIKIPHIDDLIAELTVPRRPKDVSRVIELRKIQRQMREV